jgi:hypothetical protein
MFGDLPYNRERDGKIRHKATPDPGSGRVHPTATQD